MISKTTVVKTPFMINTTATLPQRTFSEVMQLGMCFLIIRPVLEFCEYSLTANDFLT